ncbi:hypothetical protein RFI_32022 [Reticulomyxa filosa]|uniref:Transmembrane protein n=1 Tax=Reticulomyxa filosa TaxID=46433 RepID=X6LUW0_RETFI|nr:hypothetical protein RFI_32022 [Reticulomyxa filosa]|eukprot:ETO05374.1 hypothetical protein RFI_32022 [Reticulomyxa filosa]
MELERQLKKFEDECQYQIDWEVFKITGENSYLRSVMTLLFFLSVTLCGIGVMSLILKLSLLSFVANKALNNWNMYEWYYLCGFMNQIWTIVNVTQIKNAGVMELLAFNTLIMDISRDSSKHISNLQTQIRRGLIRAHGWFGYALALNLPSTILYKILVKNPYLLDKHAKDQAKIKTESETEIDTNKTEINGKDNDENESEAWINPKEDLHPTKLDAHNYSIQQQPVQKQSQGQAQEQTPATVMERLMATLSGKNTTTSSAPSYAGTMILGAKRKLNEWKEGIAKEELLPGQDNVKKAQALVLQKEIEPIDDATLFENPSLVVDYFVRAYKYFFKFFKYCLILSVIGYIMFSIWSTVEYSDKWDTNLCKNINLSTFLFPNIPSYFVSILLLLAFIVHRFGSRRRLTVRILIWLCGFILTIFGIYYFTLGSKCWRQLRTQFPFAYASAVLAGVFACCFTCYFCTTVSIFFEGIIYVSVYMFIALCLASPYSFSFLILFFLIPISLAMFDTDVHCRRLSTFTFFFDCCFLIVCCHRIVKHIFRSYPNWSRFYILHRAVQVILSIILVWWICKSFLVYMVPPWKDCSLIFFDYFELVNALLIIQQYLLWSFTRMHLRVPIIFPSAPEF